MNVAHEFQWKGLFTDVQRVLVACPRCLKVGSGNFAGPRDGGRYCRASRGRLTFVANEQEKQRTILRRSSRLIFHRKLFTEEDYDAFCLSYMFTYRDFEKGTLGLAWTGDLKNAGGVCEKNGVSSAGI